ncbi:MAG TPA: CDP-alcohol phosphatidyltransferase family protein [Prevotella sp.]
MANFVIRSIPNTLTCCNLISGCIATICALGGYAEEALIWIIIGAAFDFFDGMSARLLHVSSPIGKELDSLADNITFGFAPSAIVFAELSVMDYPAAIEFLRPYLPYFAFVIAAFSALRLAKFNLDDRQTTSFIGLPTPANALFWGSLLISQATAFEHSSYMVIVLLLLICLSSWLLVSEIPIFALKFKHWGWGGNEIKYSFIVTSVVILYLCGLFKGFWIVIALYFATACIVAFRNRNLKENTHN